MLKAIFGDKIPDNILNNPFYINSMINLIKFLLKIYKIVKKIYKIKYSILVIILIYFLSNYLY